MAMKRQEAIQKATALVAQMSVTEKASQLRYDAPAIPRLGIPAYNWWNEGLHGVARAGTATVFPQAIGLAASFDPDLLRSVGDVVSTEARAKYNAASAYDDRDIYKGLTLWSPNINIFRDPRWGRGHETYGEDPTLTSHLGVAFIRGMQGDGEYLKVAACAKHFAVHSGPEALRHGFDARASKKDLEETYLPAFRACVQEADVEAVMGAYNRVNGEPACAQRSLMVDTLRGKWKFAGHYVSDCWAIRDFHENHKVCETPEEAAALALKTGCDLNCGCTYQHLMSAYEQGLITEEDLDTACIRLFTTRYLLGMFDETPYDSLDLTSVECREHLAVSEKAASESLVLLKNNGVLPLDIKKLKTVAVIGPNADSRLSLIGNYHGTSSRYITVLNGIQDYCGQDVRVLYSEGCHLFRDCVESLSQEGCVDRLAEAQAVSDLADAIIVVLGLDETLEGEEGDTGNADASGDKLDLYLPESQRTLLDTVIDRFRGKKPIIVINMTGSCVDLTQADEGADAILQAWYPGARGGLVIAKTLFGEISPSGKLPVTFYDSSYDLPEMTDYSMKRRTYRYLDGEVLYPFGFGLTYGNCSVRAVEGAERDASSTDHILKIRVANDSDRATENVLQVYVKAQDCPDAPPHPVLGAFLRIRLNAHAEETVSLPLSQQAFETVDENGKRSVSATRFTLYAGFSQPDKRSAVLTDHPCASFELTL